MIAIYHHPHGSKSRAALELLQPRSSNHAIGNFHDLH